MPPATVSYVNFWEPFPKILHDYLSFAFSNLGLELSHLGPERLDADILVASIFGSIGKLKGRKGFKVLFSGENLAKYSPYHDDGLIRRVFDVHLGFDRDEDDVKRRFPLWMLSYPFHLRQECKAYRELQDNGKPAVPLDQRNRKICFVARTDQDGLRTRLIRRVQGMGVRVDCPSRTGKNMPSLDELGLTKHDFLQRYLFNLCPENSYRDGYITEKLIEAVFAGCIPLYWGDPEMEGCLLNRERIVFLGTISSPELSTVGDLLKDGSALATLFSRPRFAENAAKYVDQLVAGLDLIPQKFLRRAGESTA